MKCSSSMNTMTIIVIFVITTFFATTTTSTYSTISTTTTSVSNNDKVSSSSSSSLSIYVRHYHRGRFLDDKEEDGSIDNDYEDPDEDPIVMGSCLFFPDHPNIDTPYKNNNNSNNNNNTSLSSCTEFYGEADVWDYDKMVNYCSQKYNSVLTIKEECPSNYSLQSSELEIIVGWCHVEERNNDNVTLIEVTPMVTITSPTNNCSDNQRKCESVMGGTFKTTSECTTTTTSSSSSNNSTATTIDDNNEEGDSKEQDVIVGYDDGCDESKCVSRGPAYWGFNYSFTCYTGIDHPLMCADGYQPHIVESEPTISYNNYYTNYHYFTCCPPKLLFDTNTSARHCSNTTTFSDFNKTMICEDENRPYPRRMKNYTNYWNNDVVESYICCDSIINNNGKQTTNFLNDIECVPYHTDNYEKVNRNYYGNIYAHQCYDPEIGFQYLNNHGKCCKTKQGRVNYIEDTVFKTTVYPQIILSSIAVFSCIVLIVALLIPLWLYWRVQSAATNVPVSTTRAANTRLQQAAAASTYSSYNLYLVFLAIPDFILNLYLLGMYGSYANQQYNSNFAGAIIVGDYDDGGRENAFEPAFIVACSTANLYLNCVVTYEMLVILRNNSQLVTHKPPSLLKVTLQAVCVYLISIIVFIIHYFIGKEAIKSRDDDDEDWGKWRAAIFCWNIVVTYAFPIIFFFYIWITIKCRGYMPLVTDSTKQLVWFFRRIVFVFCLIWLPGMLLVVIGTAENYGPPIQGGLLFVGLQPIVSTCMAMTKADVRKHALNVVRLSYISKPLSSTASYIRMSLYSRASYIRSSLSSRKE